MRYSPDQSLDLVAAPPYDVISERDVSSDGVKISVVIPALNEAANIVRAVTSAQESGADEVIVADGSSGDETCKLAELSGAQVVSSSRGRAVQQNAGARAASGDVLLFLHADNWLSRDAISQVLSAVHRRKNKHCGSFQQRIEAGPFIYRLLERGNAERVRWLGLPYGPAMGLSNCILSFE